MIEIKVKVQEIIKLVHSKRSIFEKVVKKEVRLNWLCPNSVRDKGVL